MWISKGLLLSSWPALFLYILARLQTFCLDFVYLSFKILYITKSLEILKLVDNWIFIITKFYIASLWIVHYFFLMVFSSLSPDDNSDCNWGCEKGGENIASLDRTLQSSKILRCFWRPWKRLHSNGVSLEHTPLSIVGSCFSAAHIIQLIDVNNEFIFPGWFMRAINNFIYFPIFLCLY